MKIVNCKKEEDEVDEHQHQDWDVEKYHPLVMNILNEAGRLSNIRFPLRPVRKSQIQAEH